MANVICVLCGDSVDVITGCFKCHWELCDRCLEVVGFTISGNKYCPHCAVEIMGVCSTCGNDVEVVTNCLQCKRGVCTLCLEVVNGDPHCSDCARGVCHAQRTEEEDQISQAE